MSYILDALRKSEHERQMLTAQNLSAPSLMQVPGKAKPKLVVWTAIILSLVVVGLILWIVMTPLLLKKPNVSITQDTSVKQAPTEVFQPHKMTTESLPDRSVQGIDLTHAHPDDQRKEPIQIPRLATGRPLARTPAPSTDASQNIPKPAVAAHEMNNQENTATKGDPLKGLPPLNISGYIHTEQGVGIAMINNQLVREGDEIYPGLRLIKVLDDSAVFNYKGYIFTR